MSYFKDRWKRGFERLDPDSMGDIDYNISGRTFSISPKSGETSFHFYVKGYAHHKTSTESVVWPNTTGTYYFYFDTDGDIQYIENGGWTETQFKKSAICGLVYYNATSGEAIIQAVDEQHGVIMDASSHFETHMSDGAKWMNVGGEISGLTDASAVYSGISTGLFCDEDITFVTIASSTHPFMYRSGATNEWYQTSADNNVAYKNGDTYATWNEEVSPGVWQLTQCANSTDFVIGFFFLTNDVNNPIKKMIGIDTYPNRGQARTALKGELSAISLNGLSSPEAIFLYAYIYKRDGTLEDDGNGNPYIDLRSNRNYNLNE